VDMGNGVFVGESTAVAVNVEGIAVCVALGIGVLVAGATADARQAASTSDTSMNTSPGLKIILPIIIDFKNRMWLRRVLRVLSIKIRRGNLRLNRQSSWRGGFLLVEIALGMVFSLSLDR
jgi:hypothetical protein